MFDCFGKIQIASQRDGRVVRGVAIVEIGAHLVRSQRGDGLIGAQHAVSHRVVAVALFDHVFVQHPEGLIHIHRDFFENHVFLSGEILFAQSWAEHVSEQIDRSVEPFGEHLRMEDSHLAGSEGVVSGAKLVKLAVDIIRGSAGGPFEHHVFEKVRNPHDVARLVAGAGLDEKPGCCGVGVGIGLGDNGQAVVEVGSLERDGHGVSCKG